MQIIIFFTSTAYFSEDVTADPDTSHINDEISETPT